MSFAASEVISCSIFKMLSHWLHFSSPRAVALFSIKQPQSKCPSTLLGKSYHPVVNLAVPSVSIRQRCCTHVKMLGPVTALEEQKNFTSTMGSISVWQMHPFQRPLLSKNTHSDPEVSSWIIPEQLLQATSCSGSVCVGMFMHEAFIIELWRAQIFWDSIQRDDSSVHVQLPSLHKPGRWRGAQQTAKSNTRGAEQRKRRKAWPKDTSYTILSQLCDDTSSDSHRGDAVPGVLHEALIDFRLEQNWSVPACFYGYSQWTWKDVQEPLKPLCLKSCDAIADIVGPTLFCVSPRSFMSLSMSSLLLFLWTIQQTHVFLKHASHIAQSLPSFIYHCRRKLSKWEALNHGINNCAVNTTSINPSLSLHPFPAASLNIGKIKYLLWPKPLHRYGHN